MIEGKNCMMMPHSHFNGNGTCDAMRAANRRADRQTGMESEIAPYYGENGQAAQNAAAGRMPPYYAADDAGQSGSAAQHSGASAHTAPMPQAPRTGESAAHGYDDPYYGTGHNWTAAEEAGMNSMPQESFTGPLSADEAARNSWRALLARNVGRNVLVRFLMGTQNLITVEGELYEVGTDYIVIYQPLWDSHITADLYSVKFVEFREPPGVMTLD